MDQLSADVRARLESLLERTIIDCEGRMWTAAQVLGLLREISVTGYAAGGAVRDAIGGRPPRDLDIVADGHITGIAKHLAARLGSATITIFNEAIGSLRLGTTEQHFDIGMCRDIESIEGHQSMSTVAWQLGDLNSDARTTDFTINALYWRAETGIIDPTGRGFADCKSNTLELSSDPRKTAIDTRLSLRFALFVARGFTPTRESCDWFAGRVDKDVASFGAKLPAYLDELAGSDDSWKRGIIKFSSAMGATGETLQSLEQAADAPPESYESFWADNANFARAAAP